MGFFNKILWYKNRISAMSPAEVVHRAQEAAKRAGDRFRSCRAVLPARDYGGLPFIPGLREGLDNWQVPQVLLAEWKEQAKQAQDGQFFLLGQSWPQSAPDKKWHLDPVSGMPWPEAEFCFSINFRHAERLGDVKYVWELNRLQYVQPVAALAYHEQDESLARFCLGEIESWIDCNPLYLGINWASGIELALRGVSMLVVVSLAGDAATPSQRAKIWQSLEVHAQWLARYPSKFSSANNHRTAEGLGLFLIGALCPQLAGAEKWRVEGWEMLCETARLQILPDGVGAEQTPNYTAVVLEMLLLGWQVARAQRLPVPDYYVERLTLAGEYLRWFTDEGGNQPRIGDDDNARVIGAYQRDETYVCSLLGCVAAMTGRADLMPPCLGPHLRQALFGVPAAGASPLEGVRVFEQGGYTVGRYLAQGKRILLAMDHGYLGYLSIAAHGHADALAIWLHIGDQPVLVDAGTYLYHSGGAWRAHFRGTPAHNTLCVEKTNSSAMAGHFNWSRKANARLVASSFQPDQWWVEGEHDGYLKPFGALHRRRLSVTPARGFTVEDTLTGDKPRAVEIGFLLHPALDAVRDDTGIVITKDDTPLLTMRHDGPLSLRLDGKDTDHCGWYSPTFAVKERATRIVFAGVQAPEEKAVTQFLFGA